MVLFLWYLWFALINFLQTFDSSAASWDKHELVRCWGEKFKGRCASMTVCAKLTVGAIVQSHTELNAVTSSSKHLV